MGGNNMKKIVQLGMVLGIGASVWGWSSVMASANSQYSARRSNSVKLLWRRGMGQHTYTATRGARYSKHLGIRYSNNDVTPNVIWYTDAHEKLYDKYKKNSAIYYHVRSADRTLQGWIWRGYLKPVQVTNNTAISNMNQPSQSDAVITKTMLRNLFPNTIYDRALTTASISYLNLDDFNQIVESKNQKGLEWVVSRFDSFTKMKYINFFSQDPTSEKSVEQALTKAGYDRKARSGYQGWFIGGAALDLNNIEEGILPGEGLIFLIQK